MLLHEWTVLGRMLTCWPQCHSHSPGYMARTSKSSYCLVACWYPHDPTSTSSKVAFEPTSYFPSWPTKRCQHIKPSHTPCAKVGYCSKRFLVHGGTTHNIELVGPIVGHPKYPQPLGACIWSGSTLSCHVLCTHTNILSKEWIFLDNWAYRSITWTEIAFMQSWSNNDQSLAGMLKILNIAAGKICWTVLSVQWNQMQHILAQKAVRWAESKNLSYIFFEQKVSPKLT